MHAQGRPPPLLCRFGLSDVAEPARGGKGVGMVVSEYPAAAGQRVFEHDAGFVLSTDGGKGPGETVGGCQRVGMVGTEDEATTIAHVLVHFTRSLVLARRE